MAPLIADDVIRAKCAHLTDRQLHVARLYLGLRPEQIDGPPVGVVVGEMPGPSTAGAMPLFPWPRSSSGARLMKLGGLTDAQYLGRLRRRNLHQVYGDYSPADDRAAAETVRAWILADEDASPRFIPVLLLGERVAAAFGATMWEAKAEEFSPRSIVLLAIPHPSGRNATYRDPAVKRLAGSALSWACGMLDG